MMNPRFLLATAMMCMTALMLYVRGDTDRVLPSRPLNELPETIGPRVATDIPLDDETLEVLGKGVFLNRMYWAQGNLPVSPSDRVPISLFIGYFPTQRTGQSIHSPQNCLPGAGWTFLSSGVTDLIEPGGKSDQVGEYLITDGKSTQEVLYWYRVHGRSVANDYKAKLYTLADSIRLRRTDEALVRVITAIEPGEDRMDAHRRAVAFAEQVAPDLPAYIPD
jgi:EpsI family protein